MCKLKHVILCCEAENLHGSRLQHCWQHAVYTLYNREGKGRGLGGMGGASVQGHMYVHGSFNEGVEGL